MSKQHAFTSRTKARKRAADVVFEADQRGMGRNPDVLRDLLRERKVITAALTPLPEYSIRIVEGVADNLSRIDRLISSNISVPGLDRLAAVDLAVMRVAVWEMLANGEEVPPVIAIDEAVAIVKSVSTPSSPGFVNAVLDTIRKELAAPAWQRQRLGEAEEPALAEVEPLDEGEAEPDEPVALEGAAVAEERRFPTLADISAADFDELDEMLDEY